MATIIRRREESISFQCDDPSDRFKVAYTNKGEPFKEGIVLELENQEFDKYVAVMLEDSEAKRLRDFLIDFYSEGDSDE